MMDEYERAAAEFVALVVSVTDGDFVRVLDPATPNEECRSMQTIAAHVVWSGYSYADYLRNLFGMAPASPPERTLSRDEAAPAIDRMLAYTVETLEGWWEMSEEEIMGTVIDSRWGQRYDMEQLLEHAIVHVLRHRRQIERLTRATPIGPGRAGGD
jgi:uncharacterized damage-inducible protein DinB